MAARRPVKAKVAGSNPAIGAYPTPPPRGVYGQEPQPGRVENSTVEKTPKKVCTGSVGRRIGDPSAEPALDKAATRTTLPLGGPRTTEPLTSSTQTPRRLASGDPRSRTRRSFAPGANPGHMKNSDPIPSATHGAEDHQVTMRHRLRREGEEERVNADGTASQRPSARCGISILRTAGRCTTGRVHSTGL